MEDQDLLDLDLASRSYQEKKKVAGGAKNASEGDYVNGVHYAFARCSSIPVRKRKRPAFEPYKIDARKFLIDRVRPFPEWPIVCRVTGQLAFNTEKEAKQWDSRCGGMSGIYSLWLCDSCLKWHYIAYPIEITGNSSGKNIRKQYFLSKQNDSH